MIAFGPEHIVFLSLFIFCAGLAVILVKRSVIFVLIGIELLLNAANLNFVYFSQFDEKMNGLITAIFVVVMAAAEVSIALAILLNIFKHFKATDLDDINTLRH